jgi:hypothetical protein
MYPQSVQEATDKYLMVADKLFGMKLEGQVKEDTIEYINHYFFQKFIKGEEITLDEVSEVKLLQSYIVSRLVVHELQEKGFMGLYRDDDGKPGEDIIYLTEKGKKYLNEFYNEDEYDEQTNIEELTEYISGSSFIS